MTYGMKQACLETGLNYDTLKFYCNEGLVPNVKRDQNNRRIFDEKDIAWLKSLICLKKCGMSIVEMRNFAELCQKGPSTIPERQAMLSTKLDTLHHQIKEIENSINYIHYKQRFYNDVLSGKREYYSNLEQPK